MNRIKNAKKFEYYVQLSKPWSPSNFRDLAKEIQDVLGVKFITKHGPTNWEFIDMKPRYNNGESITGMITGIEFREEHMAMAFKLAFGEYTK